MIDSSTTDHVENYASQATYRGSSPFDSKPNTDPSQAIVRRVKAHMKANQNQEYPSEPGCEEPWTDQQEEAMLYVIEGLPITEAAQNVAVNRRTVHRWMHHPRFQRALKERDENLALKLQIEMTAVVQESFSSLSKALQKDDYAAALRYLKKVGVLDGTPIFEKDALLLDELTKSPKSATGQVGHEQEASPKSPAEGETESDQQAEPKVSEVGQVRHAEEKQADIREKAAAEVGQVGHEEQTESEKMIAEFQQYALDSVWAGESLFTTIPLDAQGLKVLKVIMKKPEFQAGLQLAHQHLQAHWSLQGKHLALQAVECIRRALVNNNGRVGIMVLKGLGVL